jgi:hypothetical protein
LVATFRKILAFVIKSSVWPFARNAEPFWDCDILGKVHSILIRKVLIGNLFLSTTRNRRDSISRP